MTTTTLHPPHPAIKAATFAKIQIAKGNASYAKSLAIIAARAARVSS